MLLAVALIGPFKFTLHLLRAAVDYTTDMESDSNGTCYVRLNPTGILGTKILYYKMIPVVEISAQSTSRSVPGGWYIKHFTVMGEPEQGLDIFNHPNPDLTLSQCLQACDMRPSCVLVYYDGAQPTRKCTIKSGGLLSPLSLLRTAIRGVSLKLVQAQGADGTSCLRDTDCQSGTCNMQNLTCLPLHCMDRLWNFDETGRDCGGSRCPACPGMLACC
jgi:hypothetical protein